MVALFALLALLLVSGCGQKEPDKYGNDVKKAFLQGCTGQPQTDSGTPDTSATNDSGSASGSSVQLGTQKSCTCVYDGLVKNVPFKDFKKANTSLQENPDQPLPKVIADQVPPCQGATSSPTTAGSSTTTAPGASSTTTAPGATSTTTAPADSAGS